MTASFQKGEFQASVVKVDALGVVFGWGIVCTEKGEEYWDTQGDHIPEESMTKATTTFMLEHRDAKLMHQGRVVGKVLHSLCLTADVAKAAYGDEIGTLMAAHKTGWFVGVKFDDPEVTELYRKGTLTGFSIGGFYITSETAP